MKEEIRSQLNNPRQLEQLYRSNKLPFKQQFNLLYPEIKGNVTADFWYERLNYENDQSTGSFGRDLLPVILAVLIAGLIAKLPALFNIDEELFYSRNIGFIIFPVLSAYFAWRNKLSAPSIAFIAGTTLAGLFFINSLPKTSSSDSIILSCIHLVLVLWCVLGIAFVGRFGNDQNKRLGFLKYNGDLVVMTALILIAGAILTGITLGLFSVTGFNIETIYFNYVGIFGLAAAPIVGTYLTLTNPQLVGKVSPVIAKLFSPLVLVMLVVYLIAMMYSGKNPYNDREFLLIFNALLVGVMAIIFFSVAETSNAKSKPEIWILFLLSLVTIIVNGVALSAIVFRISEWGITPNRAAVLGGNVLILINLLLVTTQLFKVVTKKSSISGVGKVIAFYLPVYFFWTIIVTFVFPFIFGFK